MLRRAYQLGSVIVVAVLALAVTIPIACLVILGLQTTLGLFKGHLTFQNYTALWEQPATREALYHTLIFTVGGAVLAVFLGTVMAWAVTSVRIPLRSLFRIIPICVLILPPLVKDPAMVILFSPKTGLVNMMMRNTVGFGQPFNVYSMFGMIVVIGVFSAPMAYVIMLQPLEGIDRSFIDASRMSGAPLHRTMFRVVLPMIRPALLSAVTLLVIVIASAFETPVIIGIPAGISTFMSQIYLLMNSPLSGQNAAAAQGTMYLLLTGIMVVLYLLATRNERRFVAISGRGHQHDLIESRPVRIVLTVFMVIYGLFAFVGPVVVTVLTSLVPFYSAVNGNPFKHFTGANYTAVFTTNSVFSGIITSTVLGILVAVGVVIVAGLLAFISLKSKSRFRRLCEAIAMAPIAIPALVYSIGLLLTVLSVPGLASTLYGTKGLLVLAEVIVFLPITMRVLSSALIQVQDELIEASTLAGAPIGRTIRSVLVPIIRPAMLYAVAVVFVYSYRELGAIIFLVPSNTNVVPNLSFSFWVSGGYPMLSALNMVALVVPLLIICVAMGLSRFGARVPRPAARVTAARTPIVATEGGTV
ncbi:MAG TPA: iron ABC transporter permease [Micromonosporaceae bacterium]